MERLRQLTLAAGALLSNGYLAAVVSGDIYKGPLKGVCLPFLSCFACPLAIFSCPIGALQHFMAIRVVPLMLIGGIGLLGLLVGRLACGWLCPFGLIQDLLYKLPTSKVEIPGALRYGKYLTLIFLVLLVPFATGVPWFSQLCPMGTLTAGLPWVVPDEAYSRLPASAGALFLLKLLILGAFLGLFVMAKRPFCRAACPFGAILSLFNRVSVVQLEVAGACSGCGRCQARCPVDLTAGEGCSSGECVRCLRCTACKRVSVKLRAPGSELAPRALEVLDHD